MASKTFCDCCDSDLTNRTNVAHDGFPLSCIVGGMRVVVKVLAGVEEVGTGDLCSTCLWEVVRKTAPIEEPKL